MPYSIKTPFVVNTNQTTTLGAVVGTTLNTTGLITADGGVSVLNNVNGPGNTFYLYNSNTGNSAYSNFIIGNSTGNLNMFLNGSGRSGDGGVNTATIRNDAGILRLQSNTGGGINITSGLATFDSGLTSTAGTTTLGATTIGAINGTSATFSTTLGVTGLATFGAGGLTSTAGTTTLGATTIGVITGTSASFSSTLNTTGLITANSGVIIPNNVNGPGNSLYLYNSNSGGSAYTSCILGNNTGNNFVMFLNSSTRTDDGGVNTATIRNDAGILRLQSANGSGMSIATDGLTTFGGGLTSTVGTTTLGATTIGAITGTSATFSTTLGVTGLATFGSGGLTSTAGTTTLGATTIGAITGTSATFSSSLTASNGFTSTGGTTTLEATTVGAITGTSATFSSSLTASNGFTSTAGTTTLGATTIGAITGTSATFSSSLTASNGFTSTAGTTTLGATTIGAITGTSATFSSSLTANGGVSIISNVDGGGNNFYQYNANTGTNAFSNFIIGNNTGNLNIFLNGSGRTGDGGANTATIRNGVGILRLQTSGSTGISISTNGLATFDSGLTSTAGTTTLGVTTIGAITGTSATFSTTLGVTGSASVGSLTVNSSNLVARTISTNVNWSFIFSATAGLGGSFLFCNDNASTNYIEINSSKTLRVYGNIGVDSTTASTSNTTGSITTAGGLGISNTTDATSTTNGGSITTAGGLAVAKKAFIGNNTDTASINIRSTGGTYQAGSIYSDSGWGMLFRSAVDSPILATFRFAKFDDTALMFMYETGQMSLPFTTASTSSTSGVFTTAGGISSSNTTDATSSTNGGSVTTAGGLAVAKKAFIGTDLNVGGNSILAGIQTTNFSSISTQGGYLQWNRSAIDGELWLINTTVGSNPGIRFGKSNLSNVVTELMRISDNGGVNITSTSSSTNNTSGALTLAGGLGISNTTDATSSTNGGSITTAGGLSVAKKAFIGTDLSVGGNINRTAQLVVMTINNLQPIPAFIDWNTNISGTLADMSLTYSNQSFEYSGSSPSTFYLNIGIYLTGATTGTFICEINFNDGNPFVLSRHGQYCENGGSVLASTVINMSNTNRFSIYINGADGNANNSGESYTWLRISQI